MKSSKNKPHRHIVNIEINEPHSHIVNLEGKQTNKLCVLCDYVVNKIKKLCVSM